MRYIWLIFFSSNTKWSLNKEEKCLKKIWFSTKNTIILVDVLLHIWDNAHTYISISTCTSTYAHVHKFRKLKHMPLFIIHLNVYFESDCEFVDLTHNYHNIRVIVTNWFILMLSRVKRQEICKSSSFS